ncbi:related to transposon-encoded proteins [Phanerochaete sordida]|uniref:Related to transposon-encoded proteins n=1 Tax=Phanerochaete sordida TaxID=48140 RepID=A0A9P3LMN2_9APHY|nr:related to transposon-encoded proteins [Phanerochaete sordida]
MTVVLGLNWLTAFNPLVDWSARTITFPPTVTFEPPSPDAAATAPVDSASSELSDLPSPTPRSAPLVSLIEAAAFARATRLLGSNIYHFWLRAVFASGPLSSPTSPLDLSNVPSEYHNFADVFSEEQFIRQSSSLHGAPILFVKKKDGSLRLCVDFWALNRITKKDHYPLSLISDLSNAPGKAQIYSKIDLRHTYPLVCVAEGNEWKTTFRTRYGSFEWLVIPEGLTNAPAAFQRFMNDVFRDMLDESVIVYLDDVLIYSDTPEEHRKHVCKVLHRLRQHDIYAKAPKCQFHTDSVEYLGYMLSPFGLTMSEDKVKIILDWPTPHKIKDVPSFLGFANFYRRFIPFYSNIIEAFDSLKKAFISALTLTQWQSRASLIVETNASDYALAAILSMVTEDGVHPLAFHSRMFSALELNYDVHDKELLVIFEAFRIWRHYLEGSSSPVDVITDHKNLEYFSTTKLLTRRQARWSKFLNVFNMVICFHLGRLEGGNGYASVNSPNYKPIFTSEHLSALLRATILAAPVLRAVVTMDVDELHEKIHNQTYISDISDLQLRVLQNKHDHPLVGYYGFNKTLELLRQCTNQTLKQYPQMYCNYQQNNWSELLSLAEFTYNNAPSETIGISPFYANKEYHPNLTVYPECDIAFACARNFAVDLHELHFELRKQIAKSQKCYQGLADARRAPLSELWVGDQVYVKARFFRTTCPSPKLAEKMLGPYKVVAKVGPQLYSLQLLRKFRAVHPAYHISMLEPHVFSSIPGRTLSPPPLVELDGELEYKISEIVDFKIDKRRRCPLLYKVRWLNYEATDNEFEWIPATELEHAQEHISDFHTRYPDKPGPLSTLS